MMQARSTRYRAPGLDQFIMLFGEKEEKKWAKSPAILGPCIVQIPNPGRCGMIMWNHSVQRGSGWWREGEGGFL